MLLAADDPLRESETRFEQGRELQQGRADADAPFLRQGFLGSAHEAARGSYIRKQGNEESSPTS